VVKARHDLAMSYRTERVRDGESCRHFPTHHTHARILTCSSDPLPLKRHPVGYMACRSDMAGTTSSMLTPPPRRTEYTLQRRKDGIANSNLRFPVGFPTRPQLCQNAYCGKPLLAGLVDPAIIENRNFPRSDIFPQLNSQGREFICTPTIPPRAMSNAKESTATMSEVGWWSAVSKSV
jgi:hypothetical protein